MSLTTDEAGDMEALADGLLFLIEINSFIASTAKHHFVKVGWTHTARQEATSEWESNEKREPKAADKHNSNKNGRRELTMVKRRSKTRETGWHSESVAKRGIQGSCTLIDVPIHNYNYSFSYYPCKVDSDEDVPQDNRMCRCNRQTQVHTTEEEA